eukprot:Skav211566  [mRNA]  locus=scaffold2228:218403:227954:- [translate_table: standard]
MSQPHNAYDPNLECQADDLNQGFKESPRMAWHDWIESLKFVKDTGYGRDKPGLLPTWTLKAERWKIKDEILEKIILHVVPQVRDLPPEINLANNDIGDLGISDMCNALLHANVHLHILRLQRNRIRADGAAALGRLVSNARVRGEETCEDAETFVMPLAHICWQKQMYTFCAVRIVSGKTHQIRALKASIGFVYQRAAHQIVHIIWWHLFGVCAMPVPPIACQTVAEVSSSGVHLEYLGHPLVADVKYNHWQALRDRDWCPRTSLAAAMGWLEGQLHFIVFCVCCFVL